MEEARKFQHGEVTGKVLRAAFSVSNSLGCGFLEKIYENALVIELRSLGLHVAQQVPIKVSYRDQLVGEYLADLVVEHTVLVEVKAAEADHPSFVAQTLNYLKATGLPVAMLLNFGKSELSFRRLVLTPEKAASGTEC